MYHQPVLTPHAKYGRGSLWKLPLDHEREEVSEQGAERNGGRRWWGTCVVFIVPFSEVLEGRTNFQVSRKQKQKLGNSLGQTVGKPS